MAVDRNQQGYPVRAVLVSEDGGPPQMQLSGSSVAESLTESDADAGTLTFSEVVTAVRILNRDSENDGVFTVNGIALPVPAGVGLETGVAGSPSASVTVTGSASYVVQRLV